MVVFAVVVVVVVVVVLLVWPQTATFQIACNMPCDHCSSEDLEHEHGQDSGPQDNLFSQVDLVNLRVLNAIGEAATGDGSAVIKPWDRRLDETKVYIPSSNQLLICLTSWPTGQSLESENDAQLYVLSPFLSQPRPSPHSILRVPFTSSVRLRSILLKAGPAEKTPAKVALYATNDCLDFEDVANRPATQELQIVQEREVGEYTVKWVSTRPLSMHANRWYIIDQSGEVLQSDLRHAFFPCISGRRYCPNLLRRIFRSMGEGMERN